MNIHDESIKVQVPDSSKDKLLKEIGYLRKIVYKMAPLTETLTTEEHFIYQSCQTTSKRAISTQIYNENILDQKDATPGKVITSLPHNSAIKQDWHYVVVSGITPKYTATQLAHSLKEKLETTGFI